MPAVSAAHSAYGLARRTSKLERIFADKAVVEFMARDAAYYTPQRANEFHDIPANIVGWPLVEFTSTQGHSKIRQRAPESTRSTDGIPNLTGHIGQPERQLKIQLSEQVRSLAE